LRNPAGKTFIYRRCNETAGGILTDGEQATTTNTYQNQNPIKMKKFTLPFFAILLCGLLAGTPWNNAQAQALDTDPVSTFPFTEGFEGSWIPEGWTYVDGGVGSIWQRSTIASNTGNAAARSRSMSGSNFQADEWLLTPPIDLGQGNAHMFSFYGYTHSAPDGTIEKMNVWLLDQAYDNVADLHANATLLGTFFFTQTWEPFELNLSDFDGIRYIAFHYHLLPEDNASSNNIYIDDVKIDIIPDYAMAAENTHGDQVVTSGESFTYEITLSNEGALDDIYAISITGNPQWSHQLFEHGTTNPVSSLALPAQTTATLDLVVSVPSTALYGETDSAVLEFVSQGDPNLTESLPVTTTAFAPLESGHMEDFNQVEAPGLPLGWTAILENVAVSARVETLTNGEPMSPPQHARLHNNNQAGSIAMLVSPQVTNLSENRIRFWSKCNNTSNIPDLIIGTMSDPEDPATFEPLVTLQAEVDITDEYQEFIVPFSGYTGSNQYIAFKHGLTPSFYRTLYIDNFVYEAIPDEPIFYATPESLDFGSEGTGIQTQPQTVTIGNEGLAPLSVHSVSIASDDQADFVITQTAASFPVTIEAGELLEVQLAFSPQSEGVKQATLEIDYNDGVEKTHQVPLSGEGIFRPLGSTCQNPVVATLPIEDLQANLVAFGNDYQGSWITPATDYLDGYDKVFTFTLDEESYLSGSVATSVSVRIGILILDACPDQENPANLLASGMGLRGGEFAEVPFQPGTYYALISSRPTTTSPIDFTMNLSARTAGGPELLVTPDSHDFGMVVIEESASQNFTLKNNGGQVLTIMGLMISGENMSAFSITDNPVEGGSLLPLAIGESATIEVNFSPTVVGNKIAYLDIAYFDGEEEQIHFPLSGIAFNPHAPIAEFPYLEGFEEDFPPLGWAYVDGNLGSYWQRSGIASYEGSFAARSFNGSASNNLADEWLITRPVDLDAAPGVLLSFFGYTGNNPDGVRERLKVWLLDEAYDNVAQLHENGQLLKTIMLERQWLEYQIDLRQYSGVKYIAFHYHITPEDNASLNYVYVDEVSITAIPAYEVQVENTSGSLLVNAGTSQRYQFQVTNSGIEDDTYDLALTGDGSWTYSILEHGTDNVITSLAVEAAGTALVDVLVEVPQTANPGDPDSMTLTITSQGETGLVVQQPFTTTAFRPLVALHQENFDEVTPPELPLGWSAIVEHPSSNSPLVETVTSGDPHSAPNHVRIYTNNIAEANVMLISPEIANLNHNLIRFRAKCSHSTHIPDLIIGTLSDPSDAGTFVPFQTIEAFEQLTENYQEFVVEFNDYEGDARYVAFRHGATPSFFRSIYVDDFSLELNIDPQNVTFMVTTENDAPLEGAIVELEGYGQVLTDSDGVAQFSEVLPQENLDYTISKEGYHAYNGQVSVLDEEVTVAVSLNLITYMVIFQVNDEDLTPVTDALITFNGVENTPGDYVFEDVAPGTYQYLVSREGYEDAGGELVVVDENVAHTVTLVEIPPVLIPVSFLVAENSPETTPLAGAVISIAGIDITLTTDASGEAQIELEAGAYTAEVSLEGYLESMNNFTVAEEPVMVEVLLDDVITTPSNLAVTTEGLEHGEALFTWSNQATGWSEGFEGDFPPSGWTQVVTNTTEKPLGACTWHKTGTVTYQSMQIVPVEGDCQAFMMWDLFAQDEWLITPEFFAPEGDLVFWYHGTNGSQNGDNYYVKVSTDGGENWTVLWNASDLPAGQNHYAEPAVIDLSAFAGQEIQIAWNNVAENGLWYDWALDNISVGGTKISLDALVSVSATEQGSNASARDQKSLRPVSREDMGWRNTAGKVFTGFNVFLNDMTTPVATEVSAESFMFSDLPSGAHVAGVQSVYTTGTSEIITINFSIEEVIETYTLTFDVKNTAGDQITNAVVTLDGTTHEAGIYTFAELLPGTYAYTIQKEGYFDISNVVTIVDDNILLEITMQVDDTSVPQIAGHEIRIYPNPAREVLNITSDAIILEVQVIDMLGHVVHHEQAGTEVHVMGVSGLKPGIYLLRVATSKDITTHRVQIVH
jgi:uncharacterized membrane protein